MTDYDRATWLALQEDLHGPDDENLLAETVLDELRRENSQLVEGLNEVRMMFALEDRGWDKVLGDIALTQGETPGLDLDQVKEVAEKIQTYIVGNPIIKRGTELRASYVWSKGVIIPGVNQDPGKRGRKSAVDTFYRSTRTQRFLAGDESHGEKERAAVASGMYLLLCNDATRQIEVPVPVAEVVGLYVNPDYDGEVWAYCRQWQSLDTSGKRVTKRAWYYTDRYEGKRQKTIAYSGSDVAVDTSRTIIDQTFNSQVGWPLGVPDGLAAIAWARIYTELVNHGKVMTESLARFAFKVTANSQAGANKVGVKMSGGGIGQTAAIGQGNDLQAMSSAGKSYDFNGIRPIAAMVATALEVSIVHLLSDPGAAGSSYGSASNLDLPTKRAMVARQNIWAAYLERVIKWATAKDVTVTFPALDDPDPYREAQVAAMFWNTGVLHADEFRARALDIGNVPARHDAAPDGVMLPNNEKSWARADVDPKEDPASATSDSKNTAPSPDQGRSNGTGGALPSDKNDTKEMLSRMAQEEFLARFQALVERAEAVNR